MNGCLPLRCLRQAETPWKRVSLALVFQGVREGVFGFMIALLRLHIYFK